MNDGLHGMNDSTLLDLDAIERLKDSAYDQDKAAFVKEIIGLFLESYPKILEALAAFLVQRDLQKVQRQAHHLKGLCLQVGARGMAAASLALESAATVDELDVLAGRFEALRAAADRTASALRSLIEPH